MLCFNERYYCIYHQSIDLKVSEVNSGEALRKWQNCFDNIRVNTYLNIRVHHVILQNLVCQFSASLRN